MANRIVQAIYDLKDNVTAKLKTISAAWKSHATVTDAAASASDRNAKRLSETYAKAADGVGKLRTALVAAAAFVGLDKLKDGVVGILSLGDASEKARLQLAQLYKSQFEGNKAFDAFRVIATKNGQSFDGVLEAAKQLKTLGLEPLDGTLQSLIDQNAKLGGSQETLAGISLALGQAYSKQKLQTEEILQLVERGVPAFDLLAKVTGKQGAELQKLIESGKLGRETIRALIEEIGRSSQGAAAANLGTLSGLFTQVKDRAQQFFTLVANSGALDFFKQKLQDTLKIIDQLAADGTLAKWAKSISNAIVGVSQSIIDASKWVYDHARAIGFLAATYATFKVASFTTQIAAAVTNLIAATAAASANAAATNAAGAAAARATGVYGLFVKALSLIRANPALLAIGAAAIYTTNNLIDLAQALDDLREANTRLADEEDGARQAREGLVRQIERLKQAGEAYKGTIVLQGDEVKRLNGVEATSYAQRLARAQGYYRAVESAARLAGDQVALKGAKDELAKLDPALAAVKSRLAEIEEQAKTAKSRFSEFGAKAGEAFDEARTKGETARDEIAKLFSDVDFTNPIGIKNLADSLTVVSARGKEAAKTIQNELRAQILKLSDSDLQKFREQVDIAFANGVKGADRLKTALQNINLARLGVDIDAIKNGFTETGNAAVRAFAGAVAEIQKAGLTAEQQSIAVSQAFDAAFKSAATSKELEGLKVALQDAFASGEIAADKYAERVTQINAELAKQAAGSNLFKPAADGLTNVGSAAGAAATQIESVGDASQQAAEDTDDFAQRGGDALAALTNEISGVREGFLALSEGATAAFDATFSGLSRAFTSIGAGLGFDTIRENLYEAQRVTLETVEKQRASLALLVADLNVYADTGVGAFDGVGDSAETAEARLVSLQQQVASGTTSFDLLGQEDLAGLQQALDQARSKTEALKQQAISAKESLDSMVDGLRDQVDEFNGDRVSIENRRFQQELEQIREKARLAGELGSATAAEAERLAAQVHASNLERIRREAAERNAQNAGGGGGTNPQPPNSTPRPGGGSGGGATIVNNWHFDGLSIIGSKEQIADQLARIVAPPLNRLYGRGGGG